MNRIITIQKISYVGKSMVSARSHLRPEDPYSSMLRLREVLYKSMYNTWRRKTVNNVSCILRDGIRVVDRCMDCNNLCLLCMCLCVCVCSRGRL